MADLKLKGTVEKVVRANGKVEAQVVVTIPASSAGEVPLGPCSITIASLQSSMFDKDQLGTSTKKPVRGTTHKASLDR